jgi:hypothetical protein
LLRAYENTSAFLYYVLRWFSPLSNVRKREL